MPKRRSVAPPAAADCGAAVIDSSRPKPARIAVGVGSTTAGALATCGTTTVAGGADTTGAGVTSTGAGAGVTGSDVAHAPSTVSAQTEKGRQIFLMATSCR